MSQVVSMRFKDQQMERLKRMARRLGRTASETGALLIEEALRESEFGFIDFRNSVVGRQAYITGSGLAVWEVIMIAREYDYDAGRTAEHLEWPVWKSEAALNYYAAYKEEIDLALADNDACDFESLKRALPEAELFVATPDVGIPSGTTV